MKERVAVVLAHPDDAEIWAGGTLLNHNENGDDILIYYAYPESEIRIHEAKKITNYINATVHINNSIQYINSIFQILLEFKPTIVITHWAYDGHFQHREVANAIHDMLFELRGKNKIKFTLYACGTYNNQGLSEKNVFTPTTYVDITDRWTTKTQMLLNHKSQPTSKIMDMIKCQNELFGQRIGEQYAEGFIQMPILGILRQMNKCLKGYY